MTDNPVQQFIDAWEFEAKNTLRLLQTLPAAQYDFRPAPDLRSMGELAWHLAEIEAYFSHGVSTGRFDFDARLPNLERPSTVEALAPGYEKVHADAVKRIRALGPADLDRRLPFFGREMKIRDLLWSALLRHLIHHRGQLALVCRIAGGTPAGMYGPNREEMAAMAKTARG